MTEQKKSRRQMLEEFIAKKPDDAFSRYGLALECSNTGDTVAAETHFRTLTDQFPDYIPAYLMYAQMLARVERADDARQILTAGISAARHKGDDHARSEMESLLADLS
jgi:predicted Zn-dependent protease